MNILLKGNSGCTLEIIENESRNIIRKISHDAKYSERLKKQAIKQQHFYELNRLSFIKSPRILSESHSPRYSFEMEFFPSLDYISFLQQADKTEIDLCLHHLDNFIGLSIQNSVQTTLPSNLIKTKYYEVSKGSKDNKYFSKIRRNKIFKRSDVIIESLPKSILIPLGECHGDLSLSNILFSKSSHSIIFIDFLDSYIESPLLDMVKLRQDLKHYWSFNFYESKFDQTKVELALDYMDNYLQKSFNKYEFYNQYYELFQLINFLRIFPYVTSNRIANYLLDTVESQLDYFGCKQ